MDELALMPFFTLGDNSLEIRVLEPLNRAEVSTPQHASCFLSVNVGRHSIRLEVTLQPKSCLETSSLLLLFHAFQPNDQSTIGLKGKWRHLRTVIRTFC
jgi:hypothetical protein